MISFFIGVLTLFFCQEISFHPILFSFEPIFFKIKNYLSELSGVKMEEDKKTRRQGDETNVMISGRNVSISNVLYSRIPVFLYSKTQVPKMRLVKGNLSSTVLLTFILSCSNGIIYSTSVRLTLSRNNIWKRHHALTILHLTLSGFRW